MSKFTQDDRIRLHVEDELLKFVDESHEMTRSDLQGRAHPVAQGIIGWVRQQPVENAQQGSQEGDGPAD